MISFLPRFSIAVVLSVSQNECEFLYMIFLDLALRNESVIDFPKEDFTLFVTSTVRLSGTLD